MRRFLQNCTNKKSKNLKKTKIRNLSFYDFVTSLSLYYITVLIFSIDTIETYRSEYSQFPPSHQTLVHTLIYKFPMPQRT